MKGKSRRILNWGVVLVSQSYTKKAQSDTERKGYKLQVAGCRGLIGGVFEKIVLGTWGTCVADREVLREGDMLMDVVFFGGEIA